MAHLDVTDVLFDPDFVDRLHCERIAQKVGDDGIAVNTPTRVPLYGCVQNADGSRLRRGADAERISGTIIVHTKFRLRDGREGYTADVIEFNGRRFTVTAVRNNSHFGRGFVAATCDLIPLSGGAETEDDLS